MAEGTGQMESVGVRILLQIVHDVPVLIPREHQEKVGDGRRYTVERDDVVVPELLHQYDFLVEPLCHPSGNDDQPYPGGTAQYTHSFGPWKIFSGRPEDLECDHLFVVSTLPNLSHLGDTLGLSSILHDTVEFI